MDKKKVSFMFSLKYSAGQLSVSRKSWCCFDLVLIWARSKKKKTTTQLSFQQLHHYSPSLKEVILVKLRHSQRNNTKNSVINRNARNTVKLPFDIQYYYLRFRWDKVRFTFLVEKTSPKNCKWHARCPIAQVWYLKANWKNSSPYKHIKVKHGNTFG